MTREELKKKIPHGSAGIIAQKAGVTKFTVSAYLNGRSENVLVEIAALEIVAELEEKRKGLLARINS